MSQGKDSEAVETAGASGPRPEQLTEPIIDELVERYLREMARYELAAAEVANRLRRELRAEARLRHVISFRAKHPEDLREKLRRKAGERAYSPSALRKNLNDVVTDLAGCRVLVYGPDDESRVVELIDRTFERPGHPDAQPPRYEKDSGYRATHRLVLARSSEEQLSIRGAICEIQVTTVAAHLFNELEHDTTYKEHGQTPSESEKNLLERIRHLVVVADEEVRDLMHAHERTRRDQQLIDSPEALRFVLEHEVGRPLNGEFSRLHQMLEIAVNELTQDAVVARLSNGKVQEVIERGAAVATRLGLAESNDVIHFVLGLKLSGRTSRDSRGLGAGRRPPFAWRSSGRPRSRSTRAGTCPKMKKKANDDAQAHAR